MSLRKRNERQSVNQDLEKIWQQDLKESKPHKVNFKLPTNISKFKHVQPLLEMTEPLPPKKKR